MNNSLTNNLEYKALRKEKGKKANDNFLQIYDNIITFMFLIKNIHKFLL